MRPIIALTLSLSIACGGSKDSSSTGPTPPESTETETASPVAAGALELGELSVAFVKPDGTEAGGLSMDASGAITATHPDTGETKSVGMLSAAGELQDPDGKVFAKIDAKGSVSVFKTHIEKKEGKEISREEEWETIGVIAADGTFTNAKDQKSIAIPDDGRIDLGNGGVRVNVTTPNLRRAAMFLLIASMAATTDISDTSEAVSPPAPK